MNRVERLTIEESHANYRVHPICEHRTLRIQLRMRHDLENDAMIQGLNSVRIREKGFLTQWEKRSLK